MPRLRKNAWSADFHSTGATLLLRSWLLRCPPLPFSSRSAYFHLWPSEWIHGLRVWTCNRTTKPWNLYRYNRLSILLLFFHFFFFSIQRKWLGVLYFDKSRIEFRAKKVYGIVVISVLWIYYNSRNWWIIFFEKIF